MSKLKKNIIYGVAVEKKYSLLSNLHLSDRIIILSYDYNNNYFFTELLPKKEKILRLSPLTTFC